ncbi:MAG: peptidoglycan bridge formation glycyltransferase FemA/FemB family protein [Chloroflexota bacterium]|nr:peptidoglycan bridge formation glycyltransferase FemA/FemB family protein [Chloroflexota bacterium]MDQ5867301.1 peptidoglycan bridge formation glycyltransferase FemA/FemB family protein [Chloroflexota bacterium]
MSSSGTETASAQNVGHTPQAPSKEFSLISLTRASGWDEDMRRAGASLLQSWNWGEFKKQAGWSPLRLGAARRIHPESTISLATLSAQVLFRSVPRMPLPISVAYIPRGPVAMPGAEIDQRAERAFWAGVHKTARKRGAIFLKVEPNIELGKEVTKAHVDRKMQALGFQPTGRLQPARTIVLDLDKSEDDLLKAMKPKTRYNLRLAGRRGVVVRRAGTLDDLRAFYNLLEVTGERDEFGIHTFPYYEQMWKVFGPHADNSALVLLAEHPDEQERAEGPIAGLLALKFGREAIYMYGASANRGREHMPTYLLQWEAIRWAREQGCTLYDFWGIPDAPTEDDADAIGTGDSVSPVNTRSGLRGVYWFKKGFGGREIEYPGAYDYVYNRVGYALWMRWRGANLG